MQKFVLHWVCPCPTLWISAMPYIESIYQNWKSPWSYTASLCLSYIVNLCLALYWSIYQNQVHHPTCDVLVLHWEYLPCRTNESISQYWQSAPSYTASLSLSYTMYTVTKCTILHCESVLVLHHVHCDKVHHPTLRVCSCPTIFNIRSLCLAL